MMQFSTLCRIASLWLVGAGAVATTPVAQKTSSDRLVFCHFIMGTVGNRNSSSDYDADMTAAKAAGIDAFALNIGKDDHTDTQLDYAYKSASDNDMKVFISFDFSSYAPGDAHDAGQQIAKYANESAQLMVDGAVFASTFTGDGLDVDEMKKEADVDVMFVPNFNPKYSKTSDLDGAFNWMAWPSDGDNNAPTAKHNITVEDGDDTYEKWLGKKPYMAPISPWFFTHFGEGSQHTKNWVFPSGSLLFDRWNQVLSSDFRFVELLSWNDYGESHYMGPLSSIHMDDGSSKWVNDMPHDGWLELSKPFIAAYKAGDESVEKHVDEEKIVYWYRRTLSDLDCDGTDTADGKPEGYESMYDLVYVATLVKEPATLTVKSGSHFSTHKVPAGANIITVPASTGQQSFKLDLKSGATISGTSLMDISDVCPCGLYNFNAYVGTLPDGPSDHLRSDGLASFAKGLHVTTCVPTPTLAEATDVTTAPTASSSGETKDSLGVSVGAPSVLGVLVLAWLSYFASL